MSFYAYLFFSGDCRQAFEHYQQVFGGELEIMTHAEVPEGSEMPGAEDHHVMHAALKVGDATLMGSDDPTGDGGPKVGLAVTFGAPDETEAKRVFDALAEGGEVQMPFEATFFSKGFGALVDRWGVSWMIDTEEA
ncbi:VOC family protein [Actinomarinicola tropica]|uniref:VOC family protein n=1 Tax=Actinomarinicola tropica TaxID=2789776 RepID=A0A5Q2R9Z9_9ACTN|nr:VOC family protein [Actinomarinicola tropica]QGG93709.1 VOC family protein [Actinomarinicola tropica]